MKMRKIFSLLLILGLCGCASKATTISNEEKYAEVLEKYQHALENNYRAEDYFKENLNYMCIYFEDEMNLIGYTYDDLDGDGSDELIIGANGFEDAYPSIFDVYSYTNGKAQLILQGGERNSYFITKEHIIGNQGANSAFSGSYGFYKLDKGELAPVEVYNYDYQEDEDNPFKDLNGNKISEDKVFEICNKYYDELKEYTFTSFLN